MFEFHSGGRRVSPDEFVESLKREAIESAMRELEERAYGAAASIIDPETGKHASVFIRRNGETSFIVSTRGSAAFARELEKRLSVEQGSIASMTEQSNSDVPHVYLAHASENHETLARPLAEHMMAAGIGVWLDEWEIRSGESPPDSVEKRNRKIEDIRRRRRRGAAQVTRSNARRHPFGIAYQRHHSNRDRQGYGSKHVECPGIA